MLTLLTREPPSAARTRGHHRTAAVLIGVAVLVAGLAYLAQPFEAGPTSCAGALAGSTPRTSMPMTSRDGARVNLCQAQAAHRLLWGGAVIAGTLLALLVQIPAGQRRTIVVIAALGAAVAYFVAAASAP